MDKDIKKYITVRVNSIVYDLLKELAQHNYRNVTNYLEFLIIEEYKKLNKNDN